MDKIRINITKILYLLLAAFPLMKENINSIFIICCVLFVIYDVIKSKRNISFTKELIVITLLFWMYLIHEVISSDFNTTRILLHLPFLIFPLLFWCKPNYIDERIKKQSILVFQGSVILQSVIYLIVFLKGNTLFQIFDINTYNIPLFRSYVSENSLVEIHPTYFSTFLLVSFTFSLFFKYKEASIIKVRLHILNVLFTSFFIFIFISKIIILVFVGTIITYLFSLIKEKNKKKLIRSICLVLIFGTIYFLSFKGLIKERFDEIRTEFNRPLVGKYYNSINVRVAIIKCSYKLLTKAPFFGYGNKLQSELNNCFKGNYNSDFYEITTYNTHNYYVNLVLYGGWLFLILFLFYLANIVIRIKHSRIAIVFLVQILVINFTENFFSRHYGIILFTYFISLFLFSKKIKRI